MPFFEYAQPSYREDRFTHSQMITAQVSKTAQALGAQEVATARISAFVCTTAQYLAAMNRETAEKLIYISIADIGARQYADGGRDFDAALMHTASASLWRAIEAAREEELREASNARKPMPAAAVRKIVKILERLPEIGIILETAPNGTMMVVKSALKSAQDAAAHHAPRFGAIHEVYGLPNIDAWDRANVQTVIINAIDMRAVAYVLLDFALNLTRRNRSVFAIVVHSSEIIVNDALAIASMPINDDIVMTIIAGSEKKIVSVSDVVRVE